MTPDTLQQELLDIFQLYSEYSQKSFAHNYDGLTLNEIHSIHYVGILEKPNVTCLSSHMHITKGAVTKIMKRLQTQGYVEDYRLETNKKEKYFKLTHNGEEMFQKHKSIHAENFEKDKAIFNYFNQDDRNTIHNFLNSLKNHLKEKNDLATRSLR